MGFCLPKAEAAKIIDAMKDGTVSPDRLSKMTSSERRDLFSDLVGEADAKQVNAAFEKTLLLKNQKAGMVTWAKNITGIKESARKDILSEVQRIDEVLEADHMDVFLSDLAEQKLGTSVSFKEAQAITKMAKDAQAAKAKVTDAMPNGSPERLDYGARLVTLQNYVDELKLRNTNSTFTRIKERAKVNPVGAAWEATKETAGAAKAVAASLDNSVWGRQLWKTAFTNPKAWGRMMVRSFSDIFRELSHRRSDTSVMDGVKSSVLSTKNALNGRYEKAGLAVGIRDEAFPTSLPQKVPFAGRFFKASETAYQAALYRMRAEVFDQKIRMAQSAGVDVDDAQFLKSLGKMVNSLTGRGDVGYLGKSADAVNVFLFSPRHLQSQFDFITAHAGQQLDPWVRDQARWNLFKVTAGIAGILGTAKLMDPDSVEIDPRSSDFGKIKIGDSRVDMTAGIASMLTMLSRQATKETKSATTGQVHELNEGAWGSRTRSDVLFQFMSNKMSPAAGQFRDWVMTGTDWKGDPVTLETSLEGVQPIIISTVKDLEDNPNSMNTFIGTLLDMMGFGVSTYD